MMRMMHLGHPLGSTLGSRDANQKHARQGTRDIYYTIYCIKLCSGSAAKHMLVIHHRENTRTNV